MTAPQGACWTGTGRRRFTTVGATSQEARTWGLQGSFHAAFAKPLKISCLRSRPPRAKAGGAPGGAAILPTGSSTQGLLRLPALQAPHFFSAHFSSNAARLARERHRGFSLNASDASRRREKENPGLNRKRPNRNRANQSRVNYKRPDRAALQARLHNLKRCPIHRANLARHGFRFSRSARTAHAPVPRDAAAGKCRPASPCSGR